MFTLKELFDDLAYGELANLSSGNSPTGPITPAIYPRVINIVNAALLDLHTRFSLITKEFNLHQRVDKNLYFLYPEHVGDPYGLDPEIYIDGTVEGGLDSDIIKITKAYDALGTQIPINDARYPEGIFMPEQEIVRMTPGDPLAIISLVYQASHPRIVLTPDFDPTIYKLHCPRYLKNAIVAFVASRYLTGKDKESTEGRSSISGSFWYRYESECARISQLTLDFAVTDAPEQFTRNGFV